MLQADVKHQATLASPVRDIKARVELYNGSTLLKTFSYQDALISFTIDRLADESKFFGYGVCQKLNVKLIDKERKIDITTANTLEVVFGVDYDYIYTFPLFYVTQVRRDEITGELSITAYDAIYRTNNFTVAELELAPPYSTINFATACASILGLPLRLPEDISFDLDYPSGANFDGTERLREALNALAEATQTIYYINKDWELTFKRLDIKGEAVYSIGSANYFSLDCGENRRLTQIAHTTELGDNVSVSTGLIGTTQFIRENPFFELREDLAEILDRAIAAVGGLTINQFELEWRGNYLLEIGDKIALEDKEGKVIAYSYILDDVITYDGTLSQVTRWQYAENEEETEANPITIGEALKQTYARVDKANKQIELVVNDVNDTKQSVATLRLDTEGLIASVSEDIEGVKGAVSAKMSATDVQIAIETEMEKGVDKVTTATGFTFNDEGLHIEKTGSEMRTLITEDGMTVYRNNEAVLNANNVGVDAINLHATTYLIIGNNSRFEDYENGTRTGCFWIGG